MTQDPFKIPLERLTATIEALKPQLIDGIGVIGLKFIDDNFRMQGFQSDSLQPWPKRKVKDKGAMRAILIQTGALRRSFRKEDSADHTTLSTDIPYAKIHNEGGDIRHPYREVTLSYRGKEGSLKLAKTNTQNQQRKVTQIRRSSIYNHTTHIPQRQFIGTSPVLTQKCEGFIITTLTNTLKS